MPDLTTIGLLAMTALLLAVTPGPAVFYIVTRSVSQGRAAGVISCLGVALGGAVHAAALGLFGADTSWALVALSAGGWLRRHPRFVSSERYVVGTAYFGLGLAAAVSSSGRK